MNGFGRQLTDIACRSLSSNGKVLIDKDANVFLNNATIVGNLVTTGTDTTIDGPFTVTGNVYAEQNLSVVGDATVRHIKYTNAAIPTAVAGTGAGTGPTITVTAGSTDCKMQITVLTGSSPTAAGTIMTVTYNTAFTGTLNKGVVFSPANGAAAALATTTSPYIGTELAASFAFVSGSAALAATTTYIWNFTAQ